MEAILVNFSLYKLFSQSCAVCNSHSFGGPQDLTDITLFKIKIYFSFFKIFLSSCALFISHCFVRVTRFVRFLRPVARQKSGNYTLRMILKVTYSNLSGYIASFGLKYYFEFFTQRWGQPGKFEYRQKNIKIAAIYESGLLYNTFTFILYYIKLHCILLATRLLHGLDQRLCVSFEHLFNQILFHQKWLSFPSLRDW